MIAMTDRVVIVTGASRGIGAATARVFAEAGARVALLARTEGAIAELAGRLRDGGLSARHWALDVGDWEAVAATVSEIETDFGPTDVLINNAGVIEPIAHLAASDPRAWGEAIAINLMGVYHGMRAVLPGMIARGRGTIITVGSGAAHRPLEGWSHYCASKAGALMLTKAGHEEAGPAGVVNINLSPGTVDTEMQVRIKASGVNPVSRLERSDHIPPEWPARAMLWLAGPAGREFAGEEVSLRDEGIRRRVGLID